MRLLERVAQAAQQLEYKVPVPLLLEGLFDDLGRLQRVAAAQ